MNYIISILPICLYFIFIRSLDGFSFSRWSRIVECFVWGIASCGICYFWGTLIQSENVDFFPIVEEVVKAAPLIVAIHRRRSAFFMETLTYGASIGAGFAVLENILYVFFNPDFSLGDSILRGVGTSLLHIGCTALLASMVLVGRRISKGKPKPIRYLVTIVATLPSVAIHFVYNMCLLPEYFQMVLVIIVFIGLFMVTYSTDEKLIHKWLDMCITNDIALYASIKQGKLQETNAGRYLLMAKERFSPEVFFDICVFLGLYLEMSITSKSRIIMKEAGMDSPITPEEQKMYQDKVEEIKSLRRSIGKAGTMLLSPFITIKDTDKWAMNELLCK